MKSKLPALQVSLQNIVNSNNSQMLTVEAQRNHNLMMFRADASFTVITALGTFVASLAIKVADMVSLSAKSEWRGKYGILKDYTQERDTLSAVASIRKEVHRHEAAISGIISMLSRLSGLLKSKPGWNGDAGEDFLSRLDNADEEFASDYKAIRSQIISDFRGFKCSDPQMFYPLLNAIFMAGRFNAMARYISTCAPGFGRGEELSGALYLRVQEPLIQLAHRMNFTDKHGHPLHFIFTDDERKAYVQKASKRSFQTKHADNPPVVVDVRQIFNFDDLVRASWKLETHMMELRTIDRLIADSEGHDPMYRKDFTMKRIQSCASTYEQAMLNQALHLYKWHDIPVRFRNYIDSINRRHCIDPRRRPKPVVGFRLVHKHDKRGRTLLDRNGRPEIKAELIGIWNSSFEAQQEWGTPWQAIRKSVNLKAVNDGRNNIWLSLDDYLSMTYNNLLEIHPDIAAELLRLVPELRIRTTHEIASETTAHQGTFSEAAADSSDRSIRRIQYLATSGNVTSPSL